MRARQDEADVLVSRALEGTCKPVAAPAAFLTDPDIALTPNNEAL